MREKPVIVFLTLMAGLLAGGCVGTGQSPSASFYLLSSIDPTNTDSPSAADLSEVGIGLGPIRFPDYLKRQQIVTRTNPNEIQLAEFDRWAEPLENSFTSVLKENLSILLNTATVLEPPWPRNADLEFQVMAGVSRFDAEPDKLAVLSVRWGVIRVKDDRVLMVKKSTYTVPLGSSGFEEIVRAQSQTLAEFSREIAAAVQDLYRLEHGQ